MDTPCYEWPCSRTSEGYGRANDKGRQRLVHRIVYEAEHGPLPPDVLVLHHCDNPPCFRLDHLYAGSHQDNADDRERRGRSSPHLPTPIDQRGEKSTSAKLTWVEVDEIRRILTAGSMSQAEIGARFGVSQSSISFIKNGVTWQ